MNHLSTVTSYRNRNLDKDTIKMRIISYFIVVIEILSIVSSSTVENDFFVTQSGEIPSTSCLLNEIQIENSTLSPRLQCGLYCNTLSQCVGMDIITKDPKTCRLLYGFAALIPMHTTSEQTVRYQKVNMKNILGNPDGSIIQLRFVDKFSIQNQDITSKLFEKVYI